MTERIGTEIAIVGAGPAGLVAATSLTQPRSTIVIDENPRAGGQIWRGEPADPLRRLLRRTEALSIPIMAGTRVFDADRKTLYCKSPDGAVRIEFEKLIIATGARELFLPFPGWTLPNVFGAGGLQALAKGGLSVSGRRVVVSGTGPLIFAVAICLKRMGANVLRIVEQVPRSRILKFGMSLWRSPAKAFEAAVLLGRLGGIRVDYGAFVERADGTGRLASVSIRSPHGTETIGCDMLACGFHLVPNTELAEILGCAVENGAVAVDDRQQTSVRDIYCAGEPTGIGGLDLSIAEAAIAAAAVSGSTEFGALARRRRRLRAIAAAMNRCYEPRGELRSLCAPDTIVCRCEDATFGEMSRHENFRAAKLQTRCGMGACQGKVCAAAARFLFGWEADSVRPPLFPVAAETLSAVFKDYEQSNEMVRRDAGDHNLL